MITKKFLLASVASMLFFASPQIYAQATPAASVSVSATNATSLPTAKTPDAGATSLKEEIIEDKLFSRPIFQGKAGISLFTEDTYSGANTSNKPQNSYTKGYILGNLYFTRDFYLSANLRVASSNGDATTQNYFIDQGSAFWAEVALRYDADNYSLVAGHTNINYSLSRDYVAGMWGGAFAKKEYGVDGMMVLGGAYKIDGGSLGNHALSANVFMDDTTALSDTYGTNRDPTLLSKGGPANTGKFNNYSVALDGLNIAALPKFRYQVATVKLTTQSLYNDKTNAPVSSQYLANEQRYVAAALLNKLDLGADIKLTPLVEYNRVLNAKGISGYNKSYYVGSLQFGYKQWGLGLSGTLWDANWSAEGSETKKIIPANSYLSDRWNQEQVAISYSFDNGIKATVAYKKANEYSGTTSQTVGVNLKYDLPFAF